MTTRSAEDCEMSRSCQSGTFSSPTVACDHLRRQRVRLEAEAFARAPLDLRLELRVGPHRSGELPDAVRLERALQAGPVPVELEHPARELPPERRRLGVNSVRMPDTDGVAVLLGSRRDDREHLVDAFEQQSPGV